MTTLCHHPWGIIHAGGEGLQVWWPQKAHDANNGSRRRPRFIGRCIVSWKIYRGGCWLFYIAILFLFSVGCSALNLESSHMASRVEITRNKYHRNLGGCKIALVWGTLVEFMVHFLQHERSCHNSSRTTIQYEHTLASWSLISALVVNHISEHTLVNDFLLFVSYRKGAINGR